MSERLAALGNDILTLAEQLDDTELRRQFHPALSPIGWHVRHCAFIEALWIRERVLGDGSRTAALHSLCLPELAPKAARGEALPERTVLLDWCRRTMADSQALLPRANGHPMCRDGYLSGFLVNHHAQHLETMRLVLRERAADSGRHDIAASPICREARAVPSGTWRIGSDGGFAFDNEGPAHSREIAEFAIAVRPVSNGEYLGFMEAGGYRDKRYWSAAGWNWLAAAGVTQPHGWSSVTNAEAAVIGLSRHEAGAFAVYAGARLPHEYEWEAAARSGVLEGIGGAWEWCANAFHPYPGFRFKPYREYSLPWFDGRHYVLRGAGPDSEPDIRRASFRNYYEPGHRHICAGVRLVFS
ncbi:MAG: SUMF1/EgtB/PvdO family nonheme iron enzyme [Alphaproteobacteria bacterium]|jgi:iron(II)-dependent oxidoreductase|nr:SUMF1/EgtB/PvdO family nonheme iron enzyme [Alphaproteobacteria bacterium]